MELSTCFGQGYDGAASLASERVGAAETFLAQAKKAEYFHCAMHCLNLCAAQAVKITKPTTRTQPRDCPLTDTTQLSRLHFWRAPNACAPNDS